jgi:hypothetical protein
MSSRKEFLAAAASLPLIAAAPPSPVPGAAAPAPTPSPTPNKRKISDAARALAAQMRKFDPALSDKQLEQIAEGIDYNLRLGNGVNRKGEALKNWDEPVTVFEVPA